jgi:hypothetical protein
VLILSGDQKTLWIYLWNKIEDRFIKSNTSITLTEEDTMVIENVVPGDFNYDGTLDILIMGRTVPKADDADGELQLRVYLGDGKDGLGKLTICICMDRILTCMISITFYSVTIFYSCTTNTV